LAGLAFGRAIGSRPFGLAFPDGARRIRGSETALAHSSDGCALRDRLCISVSRALQASPSLLARPPRGMTSESGECELGPDVGGSHSRRRWRCSTASSCHLCWSASGSWLVLCRAERVCILSPGRPHIRFYFFGRCACDSGAIFNWQILAAQCVRCYDQLAPRRSSLSARC